MNGGVSKCLPTVSQMAYEMSVISDLQTADLLITSQNITLAWDATSINGLHINEIHINTPERVAVINIGSLAGGPTEDYTKQICDSLDAIINLHCKCNKAFFETTRRNVLDNLKNTMTDR